MSIENVSDPKGVSPLEHFGEEVRLARTQLGISRDDLGAWAHCGYSLVAKVEAGDRVPSEEFASACDDVFPHSHGRFARLRRFIVTCIYPKCFLPYVEHESKAVSVRVFESLIIPGLLQTEDYARALLTAVRPDNLDDLVAARMSRQEIFERDIPPRTWFIVDEYVVMRLIGGPTVMRAQLERLLTVGEHPRTIIQVVPRTVPAHPGLAGPFTLFRFDEGEDVLYVDGFSQMRTGMDANEVAEGERAYDLLRAVALSPEASADLIGTHLKELDP